MRSTKGCDTGDWTRPRMCQALPPGELARRSAIRLCGDRSAKEKGCNCAHPRTKGSKRHGRERSPCSWAGGFPLGLVPSSARDAVILPAPPCLTLDTASDSSLRCGQFYRYLWSNQVLRWPLCCFTLGGSASRALAIRNARPRL
jgi:hypothetical protein